MADGLGEFMTGLNVGMQDLPANILRRRRLDEEQEWRATQAADAAAERAQRRSERIEDRMQARIDRKQDREWQRKQFEAQQEQNRILNLRAQVESDRLAAKDAAARVDAAQAAMEREKDRLERRDIVAEKRDERLARQQKEAEQEETRQRERLEDRQYATLQRLMDTEARLGEQGQEFRNSLVVMQMQNAMQDKARRDEFIRLAYGSLPEGDAAELVARVDNVLAQLSDDFAKKAEKGDVSGMRVSEEASSAIVQGMADVFDGSPEGTVEAIARTQERIRLLRKENRQDAMISQLWKTMGGGGSGGGSGGGGGGGWEDRMKGFTPAKTFEQLGPNPTQRTSTEARQLRNERSNEILRKLAGTQAMQRMK